MKIGVNLSKLLGIRVNLSKLLRIRVNLSKLLGNRVSLSKLLGIRVNLSKLLKLELICPNYMELELICPHNGTTVLKGLRHPSVGPRTGKKLTNRLPKLGLTTLSPPSEQLFVWGRTCDVRSS